MRFDSDGSAILDVRAMEKLTIALMMFQLLVLISVLVVVVSNRRRLRHHQSLVERMMQRQKRVISNVAQLGEKIGSLKKRDGGLVHVHEMLANQITHAGEHLDRKMTEIGARVAVVEGMLAASGGARNQGTIQLGSPADEYAIVRAGIASEPERNLNLVHAIMKSGNSSLLETLWGASNVIGSAMSSHMLSQSAMDQQRAKINDGAQVKVASSTAQHYDREQSTREILGPLGYLNDWPGADEIPVPEHKLNVICSFRDPVASAISLRYYQKSIGGPINASEELQRRVQGYAATHISTSPVHPESFLEWMEAWAKHELKALYGVDLFDVPIDHSRGYGIIETDRVRVLVLTIESFKSLANTLAEFYGADPADFEVVKTNDGGTRGDAEEYRKTVDGFRMSAPMLERIYSSTMMKHLYSDHQLEQFKQRWSFN